LKPEVVTCQMVFLVIATATNGGFEWLSKLNLKQFFCKAPYN